MKYILSKVVVLCWTALSIVGCNDWNTPEPENYEDYLLTEPAKPDSYYEALREYKSSKHSISFGWFGGWGDASVSTTNMLAGLPDSLDVVSLWGSWSNLSESKKQDLKFVQERKGTKVLFCSFTGFVGQNCTPAEYDTDEGNKRNEFWGWEDGDDEKIEKAICKYANAILDTLKKYNYSGFDIDYEPDFGYGGPLADNKEYMGILIRELGKYIGPKSSNPEKLFLLDGQITSLPAELGGYFSYLVSQAYSGTQGDQSKWRNSYYNLDIRLDDCLEHYKEVLSPEEITNKFIVTENLEPVDWGMKGGYRFMDRDGVTLPFPSLIGMARWLPTNGFMKGGFGGYRIETDRTNTPAYYWLRQAIQDVNPAIN